MAHDACDRHAADPGRVALIVEGEAGGTREWTFHRIRQLANRCANLFESCGIEPGDRVSILLGQALETAIANLACFKCGAVSMPLFTKFSLEDLEFRLADGAARLLVTDIRELRSPRTRPRPSPRTSTRCSRWTAKPTARATSGGSSSAGRDATTLAPPGPRTPPCSSIPPAPPALRRECSTRSASFSGTSRAWTSPTTTSGSRATACGHRRTGPGLAGSSTSSCPPGTTDFRWSPRPRPDFDPEAALDILARHRVRNTLLLPDHAQAHGPGAVRKARR